MMTGFTEKETAQILKVKDRLYQTVQEAIVAYPWAKETFSYNDECYITGGAIASLLLGEKPKDFDVYFRTEAEMKTLSKYLMSIAYIDIADVDDQYRDAPVWTIPGKKVTEKSITMTNGVSFIVMNSGTPAQIKAGFDFVHCTPHYEPKANKLYMSRKQFDSIMNKTLVVNNEKSVTRWRLNKFIDRGWKTTPAINNLATQNGGTIAHAVQVNS